MKNYSIWLDHINYIPSDSLNKNIDVDVLIIGGGITGFSTAYHLRNSKLKVCLVEKNEIAHGVSSRTTGKLTFLQENIYTKLKKYHNFSSAKLYLKSQKEAIKIVDNIIRKNEISCDYQKADSILFTEDNMNKIKKEKDILGELGVKVKILDRLPNGRKIKYGISVDKTAVFHPIKYLIELKKLIEDKVTIYENTKITDIEKEKDGYICKTNQYKIRAKKVVLAVHYPYFLIPYFMPLKCHLEKSYIGAYKIDKIYPFSAINVDSKTISIRYQVPDFELYLSESHNISFSNNDDSHFCKLKQEILKDPIYLWSNKDMITNDLLPYIGELKDNLFIGTGYNTWGMTNGTIAGKIISDMIKGKQNEYSDLFHPKRGINLLKVVNFPLDMISSIKSFVETKMIKDKSWYSNRIQFDQIDGKDVAIYKDEEGKNHIVYQKCPHLKCNLIFNEVEKTWDCPCHGSRFDLDGNCIEGPSNYNIRFKK